ncbi:type II toxin-antitoxin system Phd/YefM family antitoxin [Paraburkholderia sp. J94]|uniref:type II toxin-antitoxin system Phd/YefM family antitoxin n=1 Tax=Paraburkholderia sp. J94 TaxID=2805441 RepID=UPI002AB0E6FF|nr:type II toxin-antitoxin system Phd/YefM family antitoxin [Paraburkholderia sp. J94]
MEKRVSKAMFKAKACELFRQVEMLGESVVVTDRGQPTIEIRPYRAKRKSPLDSLRAAIVHCDFDPPGDALGEALSEMAGEGERVGTRRAVAIDT